MIQAYSRFKTIIGHVSTRLIPRIPKLASGSEAISVNYKLILTMHMSSIPHAVQLPAVIFRPLALCVALCVPSLQIWPPLSWKAASTPVRSGSWEETLASL